MANISTYAPAIHIKYEQRFMDQCPPTISETVSAVMDLSNWSVTNLFNAMMGAINPINWLSQASNLCASTISVFRGPSQHQQACSDLKANLTFNIDTLGRTNISRALLSGNSPAARLYLLGDNVQTGDYINGSTAAHGFAKLGSEGVAQDIALLNERGANLNALDKLGRSPVHYAAMNNPAALSALIQANADLDVSDANGITPLMLAAKHSLQCMEMLLNHGAEITGADNNGNTVWHHAASSNLPPSSVISMLQHIKDKFPAGMNAINRYGLTPFHAAAHSASSKVVAFFLQNLQSKYHEQVSHNIGTVAHIAAKRGDAGVLQELINFNVSMTQPNALGLTPLHLVCRAGHEDAVAVILANRAAWHYSKNENVLVNGRDIEGKTPLYHAAGSGNPNIVKRLLDAGANPNTASTKGATPLYLALSLNYQKVAKLLQDQGAPISSKDLPLPLHSAIALGSAQKVSEVLLEGAELDKVDPFGRTPLMLAVILGREDLARELMSSQVVVDTQDPNGMTALHLAAQYANGAFVKHLISRGASIEQGDRNNNMNAFHYAAVTGNDEILNQFATNYPSKINAADNEGSTPLHHAVTEGHESAAMLLLDHKASTMLYNNFGLNVIHLAAIKGMTKFLDKALSLYPDAVNIKSIGAKHTPSYYAALHGQEHAVSFLVSKGGKVQTHDSLTQSFETGLTTPNLAPEAFQEFVAQITAGDNIAQLIEGLPSGTLLETNHDNQNALHLAAIRGKPAAIRQIIGAGISVTSRDSLGRSPLYLAAEAGNKNAVLQLLAMGANLNAANNKNETPLLAATLRGKHNVVKMLQKHGAILMNASEDSPESFAILNLAAFADFEGIQELLELGANINFVDAQGRGVLHYAIKAEDSANIIRKLLHVGADVNLADRDGKTALHLANEAGNRDAVYALLSGVVNSEGS